MTRVGKLHEKWMDDPEYRKEYEALEDEFSLVSALIRARTDAGLTQDELAKRMNTTQSVIARLESGRVKPSSRTLQRFASATGMRMKITFVPDHSVKAAKRP
jgi:transcriptional regulator with XRE-family HTH domain